jgi:hypothetical protein
MRSEFGPSPAAGNGFLDAETGRQKSPLKRATVCRDQSSGIGWPKVPAETPCLASYRKYAVCKGWMVVDAVRRNRSPTKEQGIL